MSAVGPKSVVTRAQSPQPGEKYQKLNLRVWESVSIYDGPGMFLEQFRKIPVNVGHLAAAHWCQSEVCNGAFYQFFENSTGVLAPEALEGFRAIGLSEWAEALTEAMKFFGGQYPRDRSERQKQLARIPISKKDRREWDPFYHLDDRFYEWLHAEQNRWENAADAYATTIAGT